MKKLGLLIDLSHAGFAAVLDESCDEVLSKSVRPAGTRHDDVADWTESLLREAGGTFADLAWIAVGVGPGSFTGIRIAMSFAQGLALPNKIPVHGFTSFEALLLSTKSDSLLEGMKTLAAIPANAGRFYVAEDLKDPGALISGESLSARATQSTMIVSPEITPALQAAAEGFGGVWSPGVSWDAVAIARHARASGRGLARPMYLQLSAAEEKLLNLERPD